MSREIWKPIPSAPGWLASSLGRLCLPARKLRMPNGGFKTLEVKPTFGVFCSRKKRFKQSVCDRTRWVAPLICEAFNGPRPSPGMECMHGDEDSKNNVPTNLAWGTKKENHQAPKYLAERKATMLRIWAARKGLAACQEH